MLRIEISVMINRPVHEVWDFITDLRNSPRWTRSGSEVRQTSEGALGVGATLESRRRVLGRFEIKSQTILVTEYEPNRAFSYTAKIPLLRGGGARLTFEPAEEGTRLTRSTEVELGRALRWLQPILARVLRSAQETELANLKRLIEARA
jgi:uncharacterized protein YndB with AHSA1/START domain